MLFKGGRPPPTHLQTHTHTHTMREKRQYRGALRILAVFRGHASQPASQGGGGGSNMRCQTTHGPDETSRQLEFLTPRPPPWTTLRGNVLSLAQFRDNVLVGAKGPTARHEMQHVCHTLTEVWSLCDCTTKEQQVCTAMCMTQTMTAMGITTHVQGQPAPLVYAQPSGLTSQWHLKYTVTL